MSDKNAKNPDKNPDKDDRRSVAVEVALHGQSEGQTLPATRAYLFDRSGQLVSSAPVGGEPVKFDVPAKQDFRVAVGPDLLTKDREVPPNLSAKLARANAVSHDIRRNAVLDTIAVNINPNIWFCWIPTCINVHGTVTKAHGAGGTATICSGTVQIFEVDLGCTLDRFSFVDLSALRLSLIDRLGAQTTLSTRSLQTSARVVTAGTSNTRAASSAAASSTDLSTRLATVSGSAFKQLVVANKAELRVFLCELIPDWAFCWQELGTAAIQSDGTFSAEVCFWCPDDLPDLYFEVVQNIDGTEVEISDPQIACSTYYDYDGSSSVDIVVTDPRAIACLPTGPDGPGYLYVWPTAIGNQDLGNIDGLATGSGTGLLPGNTPFGGTLSLQMVFHRHLIANNIRYYRWSYSFDGGATFHPITAPVTHRYITEEDLPDGTIVIHKNSVNLGPRAVGTTSNLFEIPDPNLPWINIDDPADRPFAYFDSTGGVTPRLSGMCTLMLETFDGAGNFLPCNNVRGASTIGDVGTDPGGPGTFTYILPQAGGPPDTYTNAGTGFITDHGRLFFRILVDNNSTVAELPRVATPLGSTDTDPCGVLHYSSRHDNVEVDYVAWHPHDYLDWDLSISRGIQGVIAGIPLTHTSAGSPGAPVAFNNSAGTLLGACDQAAFAVNLYCRARATNGYGTQTQYDSSATIAFALLTVPH